MNYEIIELKDSNEWRCKDDRIKKVAIILEKNESVEKIVGGIIFEEYSDSTNTTNTSSAIRILPFNNNLINLFKKTIDFYNIKIDPYQLNEIERKINLDDFPKDVRIIMEKNKNSELISQTVNIFQHKLSFRYEKNNKDNKVKNEFIEKNQLTYFNYLNLCQFMYSTLDYYYLNCSWYKLVKNNAPEIFIKLYNRIQKLLDDIDSKKISICGGTKNLMNLYNPITFDPCNRFNCLFCPDIIIYDYIMNSFDYLIIDKFSQNEDTKYIIELLSMVKEFLNGYYFEFYYIDQKAIFTCEKI